MAHRLLPIPYQVTQDVTGQPHRRIILTPISGLGEGAACARPLKDPLTSRDSVRKLRLAHTLRKTSTGSGLGEGATWHLSDLR